MAYTYTIAARAMPPRRNAAASNMLGGVFGQKVLIATHYSVHHGSGRKLPTSDDLTTSPDANGHRRIRQQRHNSGCCLSRILARNNESILPMTDQFRIAAHCSSDTRHFACHCF